MLNISSKFAIAFLVVASVLNAFGESDFEGSPYQLLNYSIRDTTKPTLADAERVFLTVDNSYYLYLPLSTNLPNSFEATFQLTSIAEAPLSDPQVVSLYLPATYELYWNDLLIGYNGKLDSEGSELRPGDSYRSFPIPSPNEVGQTNQLRIKGVHTFQGNNGHALVLTLQTISERLGTARANALTYSLYFAFALFGVYLLASFFSDRSRIQYLLLGLTCIVFGLYALNKLLYLQLNVPYPYLDWIGYAARSIFILLSILIPVTLLYILRFRRKPYYLLSLIPLVVSSLFPSLEIIAATAYLSIVISGVALFQKRKHSVQAIIVSAILWANYEVPYFEQRQTIGFSILAAYLLVSIINLQRRETRSRHQAQIRNSRLQLELLKSKIEPHFVLNSLTSAIEWIETNPRKGVKLIQALASEFELLSNISDKTEIPIATELESCRSYLEIMGYRKKASYQLELDNLDLSGSLPPSVIRNLLENAISHNDYGQAPITFTLSQTNDSGRRKFRFTAPLEPTEISSSPPDDGTGIRYIKARLAESYAFWSFTHGPRHGLWETEILVP